LDRIVFAKYAIHFAQLFHEKKQNDPVIFLSGPPGVGRSALIEQTLRTLLNNHLIGIISNTKSDNQFYFLKEKSIAIFNEFSEEYVNTSDLKLLLEGAPIIVSEKFKPSTQINTPGQPLLHMVLISNDPIPHNAALQRRLISFYLHPPSRTFTREEQIKYQEETTRTAVSFILLSNWIYFKCILKEKAEIPEKWTKIINYLSTTLKDDENKKESQTSGKAEGFPKESK
jgi:hypothetical protein